MSEQRTVLRFRGLARNKLSFWLGDKLDELMFLTVSGRAYTLKLDGSTRSLASQLPQLAFAGGVTAPSSARVVFPNAVVSEATVTAADTMTWKFIVKICAFAKFKRIKPVKLQGKDYYAIVMSPQQARDLKTDTDYMTNVGRAQQRGDKNPLFTGAFAIIDGVALFDHPKVYNTTGTATKWGAGSLIEGAQAMLYGAQALGFARIGDPVFEESDNTDYKNRQGIGYGRMIGMLKPVFRSIYDSNTAQDFGAIAIKTAAAQ